MKIGTLRVRQLLEKTLEMLIPVVPPKEKKQAKLNLPCRIVDKSIARIQGQELPTATEAVAGPYIF